MKNPELQAGQLFKAEVFVDAGNEDVNAIEGIVTFPPDLLDIDDVNDANSIFSLWIRRPASRTEGQISFAGIIPGGYDGKRGLMFSATFLAKKAGSGSLGLAGVRMLRNDGRGSEVAHTVSDLRFVISEPVIQRPETAPVKPAAVTSPAGVPESSEAPAQPPQPAEDPAVEGRDQVAPEEFVPRVAVDERVFGGKPFLVFAAQDKGSGMDHYEVCEGGRTCVVADSPYMLLGRGLKEDISVKAVDKEGNVRTAVITAQSKRDRRPPLVFYALIAAAVIISGAGISLARRRLRE